MDHINIPQYNDCIMAINIDINNNKETIIIGSESDVISNVVYNYTKPDSQIIKQTRNLGDFIKDLKALDIESFLSAINMLSELLVSENSKAYAQCRFVKDDISKYLTDSLKRQISSSYNENYCGIWDYSEEDAETLLYNYFDTDNIVHKFFAAKMWSDYKQEKEELCKTKNSKSINSLFSKKSNYSDHAFKDSFYNKHKDIFFPLNIDIRHSIMNFQYFKCAREIEFPVPGEKQTSAMIESTRGYYFTIKNTFRHAVMHYARILYQHKLIVNACSNCHEIFICKKDKRIRYCDECKKEMKKRDKLNYDSRNKNSKSEKIYNNTKAFFNYRLTILKKNYENEKYLQLRQLYDRFRKEAVQKKKLVIELKVETMNDFANWNLKKERECLELYNKITDGKQGG